VKTYPSSGGGKVAIAAARAAAVPSAGSETTSFASTLGGRAGPKVRVLSTVGEGSGQHTRNKNQKTEKQHKGRCY
jgi:hypothetical protein